MDKQEFKRLVEAVAEIEELKPKTQPDIRLDDTHIHDVLFQGEWTTINKQSNPSLGFRIVKIHPVERDCQLGCGDRVTDQVIERRLSTYPQIHWKTKCTNCGCYLGPDGQGFVDDGVKAQNLFTSWFKSQETK